MVPRAFALASLVAALLAAPLFETNARAQDGIAGPDGAVALRIVGPDDPALRDSIRELLARLHLALATARSDDAGAPPPLVARVEIDLSSPTDVVLVVSDPTGEQRVRRTVPRESSSAIVREEIAHTVQSEVESALLAARERASRPAPPPLAPAPVPLAPPPAPLSVVAAPPAKEQPRAEARRAPLGFEITTLVGVSPVTNNALGTRIGLETNLLSRWPLHPAIALSALYAVPFDEGPVGDVELSAHVNLVSLRALPSLEIVQGRWFALDVGAGAGMDLMMVSSNTPILLNVSGAKATNEDPILSAVATAHFALASGVSFLLSAGVDVDPVARRYVLVEGATPTNVFVPSQTRPMILAGLGFDALGDMRFGGERR